ncbi:MAG: ABC transporter ATP-binding protein [Clostridia bacterium]|nr:ABC transporter ATP-binding protein [Clostridia bacterium]
MKKLLRYIKPYIKECILSPLFKMLEALLDLAVPMIIAQLIDVGLAGGGDTGYIIKMCCLLIGLGLVGLGFSVTAQYFAAKASVSFVARVRQALFSHIQTLTYTEIDTLGTSSLITRMTSDANQVQNGTNLTLRLIMRSPFVVFGAMIMAFTIDKASGGIFAASIGVLSVIVFGIMLSCVPLYKKVQSRLDGVLEITKENLTGARVIRAFCLENEETEEFSRRNNALTKMQEFTGRISALMNPLTYIVVNLAIVWLIHTDAIKVNTGLLTQGAVVALYNYMSQILVELVKLASLIISITKAVACGNRIQAVLEIEPSTVAPEKTIGEKSGEYAVEFNNVYLRYKNAAEDSLSAIDFKVKHGETVGIIGGTGSGKTSLVNMIAGFYRTREGSVLIDGIDVKNYSDEELIDKVGIVPQKAVLFGGTIRENMRWGNENADDNAIMNAVEAAQAADVVKAKGGLDAVIEQGGRNLSGGQRQRLTIARALVKNPEILILDDSASALDFATDASLRKAINEKCNDTTVFIVSQRTASVMGADKILVLDDGEAVGAGTHSQLMENCAVYREIYDSQFKKEGE